MKILEWLTEEGIEWQEFNHGLHLKVGKHINIYPTTGRFYHNISGLSVNFRTKEELMTLIKESKIKKLKRW